MFRPYMVIIRFYVNYRSLTLYVPLTGETVPAKVIHRQPHNSNLLEEMEDDIQLDTP